MKQLISAFFCLALALPSHAEVVVKNPKNDFPPPQLGIAPPRIEQDLVIASSGRLDQSVTFFNYSPKPKSIRLSLYDVDSQGKVIESNDNTLVPWTILNPTTFTIPGNGEQTIRLSIRPAQAFLTGTHRLLLKITQHVPDAVKMDEDGKGVTISIGSSYGLPIIVHVK